MIVERAADDDLVVRSAAAATIPRWLGWMYAVQAVVGVLLAVGSRDALQWAIAGLWLVSAVLFAVVRHRELRRGPKLTLSRDSLTFRPAFGRTRTYPWQDVLRLDIDPHGAARVATLTLRSGTWRRLVIVPDEQVDQVKARWAAVQAGRKSLRPGAEQLPG